LLPPGQVGGTPTPGAAGTMLPYDQLTQQQTGQLSTVNPADLAAMSGSTVGNLPTDPLVPAGTLPPSNAP